MWCLLLLEVFLFEETTSGDLPQFPPPAVWIPRISATGARRDESKERTARTSRAVTLIPTKPCAMLCHPASSCWRSESRVGGKIDKALVTNFAPSIISKTDETGIMQIYASRHNQTRMPTPPPMESGS